MTNGSKITQKFPLSFPGSAKFHSGGLKVFGIWSKMEKNIVWKCPVFVFRIRFVFHFRLVFSPPIHFRKTRPVFRHGSPSDTRSGKNSKFAKLVFLPAETGRTLACGAGRRRTASE